MGVPGTPVLLPVILGGCNVNFYFSLGVRIMETFLYLVNVGVDDEKKILVPLTAVNARNKGEVHNVAVAAAIKADADVDVRTLEVLICNPFCRPDKC